MAAPNTLGGGTLNAWINATNIPGLDGSSVISITESSSTARVLNVVTGIAPILRKTAGPNGTAILDHTGAAGGLHSAIGGAATPGGDFTYFAVVRNSSATSQALMMGQTHYMPYLGITAPGRLEVTSNAILAFAESTASLGAGWSIVVITFTAATRSTHFDINDITQDVSLGGGYTFPTDQGVSYGESFAAGTFAGKMAEIGLYSSVLSALDITALKDYLKVKYALPLSGPAALGGGTLNAWINASSIAGVDGSSVTSITESSPTARVLNVVSGTAPILRKTAGPNGTAILDHTGAPGGLHSAIGGAATPGGDLTYFAVVRNSSANAQALMMGQDFYMPYLGITSTSRLELNSNSVEPFAISTTPIALGWSIIVVTFTAATKSTHFDIDDATQDLSVGGGYTFTTNQGISYGEYFTTGTFAGKLAEIGLYSSVLSGADITTLKNYLKAKYALPAAVQAAPGPPIVNIYYDKIYIDTPAILPGTSTSFSLYENGVKIAGLLPVNYMFLADPRDPTVTYSYTARGDGPNGETDDSAAVSGMPNPTPNTGLTATSGNGQITLNWNAKSYSGPTYSDVFRDNVQIAYGPIGTSFVDSGLAEGSAHIYKIRSVVFNPGRYSAFSPNVGSTTIAAATTPVRNPNLIFDVGGPSYSAHREDMLDDPRTIVHQRALRTTSVAWSAAERAFTALEFLPPEWLPMLAGPSREGGGTAGDFGAMLYFEDYNTPGPYWNFGPGLRSGGFWWVTAHRDLAIWIWAAAGTYERVLIHEIGHHFNHVVRLHYGLDALFAGQPASPGLTLAEEYVTAVKAADALRSTQSWGGTNADEMAAESYTALIVANADPSYLIVQPNVDFPAGVRADEWILKMCGNNANLTARWITELTPLIIWPAAPWPVSRTMATQAKVDARRNAVVVPIQNLDSNEGPTLLLADATNGYRAETYPVTDYISQWVRSDRPLPVACNSDLLVQAGSPTQEISNHEVFTGLDAIPAVRLLGEPSEQWRTTVTFRVGELLAVNNILWHAIETSPGGVETEYAIAWNGATVSASLTRRAGTGGAVIDTTIITSGNVLTVGERCTVQAVWGAQGTPITLRHRTASAVSITTLTSSTSMPTNRLAVKYWSMPIPHGSNVPTLSYCALAAVSVETIFDIGGVGPMTWMDAEYT